MNGSIPPWLAAWWNGGDTGLSSRYLAACFSGVDALIQTTEAAAPRDTSDVGRCVRLLDIAAKNGCDWRGALSLSLCKAVALNPKWAKLAPRWAEIEAAFHEDVAAQNAWNAAHPRHRSHMRGRSKRAVAHNAIAATFPPSRCWWLVATTQEHYDPYDDRKPHPFAEVKS